MACGFVWLEQVPQASTPITRCSLGSAMRSIRQHGFVLKAGSSPGSAIQKTTKLSARCWPCMLGGHVDSFVISSMELLRACKTWTG
jgi:hypothetical protein